MQTLKRGLEGKGRAEAAAMLHEQGTFLLHFVTTKPWSGNKREDQVYRGEPARGGFGGSWKEPRAFEAHLRAVLPGARTLPLTLPHTPALPPCS